jgi:hypothetical protein
MRPGLANVCSNGVRPCLAGVFEAVQRQLHDRHSGAGCDHLTCGPHGTPMQCWETPCDSCLVSNLEAAFAISRSMRAWAQRGAATALDRIKMRWRRKRFVFASAIYASDPANDRDHGLDHDAIGRVAAWYRRSAEVRLNQPSSRYSSAFEAVCRFRSIENATDLRRKLPPATSP